MLGGAHVIALDPDSQAVRRHRTIQGQEAANPPAPATNRQLSSGAFFWLSAFWLVYCARPEDWVPGLGYLPLAKITGFIVVLGLLSASGKTSRRFRDLPIEGYYFLALICLMFFSALLSPVWKSGSFFRTVNFGKAYIAWILVFLLVTDFAKLRRLIFIQAASVAAIAVVSIVKGHSTARLRGVLGGIYSNPNDLAFAIVLSLPFCLMFLLSAKGLVRKAAWTLAGLAMAAALFLTASRAGFINLVISGSICLWHFGIKGRRFYLIVATGLVGVLLMATVGRTLRDRFTAISGEDLNTDVQGRAYSSYQARMWLMRKALEGIEQYPILGIGADNFFTYSGEWHEVHMTYLQIAVEGGIPVLILYLLFIARGFRNLKRLRKRTDLNGEMRLFTGALHASLIGFVVGACFAPEAYQFFPYFIVAYTSVFLAVMEEGERVSAPAKDLWGTPRGAMENYALS